MNSMLTLNKIVILYIELHSNEQWVRKTLSLKMPTDIASVIRPLLNNTAEGSIVELEVRFQGFLRTKYFHNYLLSKYLFGTVEESIVESYNNDLRVITTSDSSWLWEKKSHYRQKERLYTFSIATEILIADQQTELSEKSLVRKRQRRAHQLSKNVTLMLTTVNEKEYEVEVELELSSKNSESLRDLDSLIEEFFSVFDNFNTNVVELYYSVCKEFLEHFNKGVNAATGNMDDSVTARPRPFKLKDFNTYGPFPTGPSGVGIDTGYTLTVKGDGLNTVLGIIKGRYVCVGRTTEKYFNILETNLHGYGPFTSIYTVEETMYIGPNTITGQNENKNPNRRLYTCYDILYDSRAPGLPQLKNHLDRLALAKEYSKPFLYGTESAKKYPFEFFFKNFHPIGKTPEEFAVAYKKATKDSLNYPFGNDGFILTPIYTLHNPYDYHKAKNQERILGKQPDLCKIKPFSHQSVDLVPSSGELLMTRNVPFRGTSRNPFDPEVNVVWSSIPEEAYGRVVEFKAAIVTDSSGNDIKALTFGRYRDDKVVPNDEVSTADVWNDIGTPILDSVWLNEDYRRLRRQNNRVKTELINSYPDGCIVVDIGTGTGGDIDKYLGKAVRVICVEIRDQNLEELKRRIESLSKQSDRDIFSVLHAGGQDTDVILEEYLRVKREFPLAPTVISSMFSLTFFWKSRKFLDQLMETFSAIASFSPGTKFGFITYLGDRLLKLFDANGKIREKGLLANYDASHKGGISIPGRVKIQMPGTIVDPQYEFLVDLDDMKPEITVNWTKDSVIERYLSEKERRYGMTAVYGMATVNGNYSVARLKRMLRSGFVEKPFVSVKGVLEFESVGNNYYRIRPIDNIGDVLSNFLVLVLNNYESTPVGVEVLRDNFYNEFVEALLLPDPRYPGKRVRELYSGQDPLTLFPVGQLKLPSNARLFTLSRGRFQNEFFKEPTGRGKSKIQKDLVEIVKSQLDSDTPSVQLYLMIADYLEISIQIIDGLSDLTQSGPVVLETWVSLPRSYMTVLFITDENTDHIYPVGERGLDGKIITRFVN